MKYNLNDKPKATDAMLGGLQWFTAILPFLIVLPTLLFSVEGGDEISKIIYFQKIFILSGFTLLAQLLLGHGLPILSGPATVLLIGLMNNHNISPAASYTAIAIGGVLTGLLSFGHFFEYLQKIFTTRVIIVILILVAVTLLPLILKLSVGQGNSPFLNVLFAITLTLFMLFANSRFHNSLKSLVVLLGITIGSIVYYILFGFSEQGVAYSLDWKALTQSLVIRPEFDFATILAFVFCFLALMVNQFGAIQATGLFVGADALINRTRRGVRVTGFFNLLSGVTGVVGQVDYGMSPGIITATNSASRYPLFLTAALLVAMAFIPQSITLFSYIPGVVMASMLFYLMCNQLSSGLQLIVSKQAISDFSAALTVGFPVMLGIFISFAPQSYSASIPDLVRPILGNGFIMGAISVLFMEHVYNRTWLTSK